MRIAAIFLVVAAIGAALYITDRKVLQQENVHAADSLDSISSWHLHHSTDSMLRIHDRYYNARLNQLKLRLDFQNSMIYNLSQQIDSLKENMHGR